MSRGAALCPKRRTHLPNTTLASRIGLVGGALARRSRAGAGPAVAAPARGASRRTAPDGAVERSGIGGTGALPPVAALGIVALVLGASALVGRRNAPDPSHPGIRRWYRRLHKPGFTPPDAAFGAVWPALEAGLAIGGYRLLRRAPDPARNAAVGLWLANTAMIGGWTELFFRRHRLGASAAASGAMVASGTALVAASARVDGPAAALATPFVAWLGFAMLLATRIRRDNAPCPPEREW